MTPGVSAVVGWELLVERPGPLDRPLLRLDHGEAAELRTGAGHHAPLERTGEGRVLLHERLGEQVVESLLGDSRDHEVLVGADPDVPVAVGLGQAGELHELYPVHPADGDGAADVHAVRPASGGGHRRGRRGSGR